MENIKFGGPEYPEYSDEEVFRMYFENLDLKPEDFNKEILDIGSGSTKFAKWAEEHHISKNIYSIDENSADFDKFARADALSLPFKDNSFDLVLSHAAIPNIFSVIKNENTRKNKINQSLNEMFRVLKSGGQIKIGPVVSGKEYKKLTTLKRDLLNQLEHLKKNENLKIEIKQSGKDNLIVVTKF